MQPSPGSERPRPVYGVDFSAAAGDAGAKTWVASGTVAGDDTLEITGVAPLVELLDLDAAARETALPALAAWIRALDDDAVVGLDFPFGLPAFVVREAGHDSWRSFISGFPEEMLHSGNDDRDSDGNDDRDGNNDRDSDGNDDSDAADPVRTFTEHCVGLTRAADRGTYAKRETDAAVGARSPYGFIADTISFYGMRDVLSPIADDVRVMPMDARRETAPNGPTVVETYPAAVFDRRGLCRTAYKGTSQAERARRRRNADGLANDSESPARSVDELVGGAVSYRSDSAIVEAIVADANGDGLDAVAACVGAYGAWRNGFETDDDIDLAAVEREGYIYA